MSQTWLGRLSLSQPTWLVVHCFHAPVPAPFLSVNYSTVVFCRMTLIIEVGDVSQALILPAKRSWGSRPGGVNAYCWAVIKSLNQPCQIKWTQLLLPDPESSVTLVPSEVWFFTFSPILEAFYWFQLPVNKQSNWQTMRTRNSFNVIYLTSIITQRRKLRPRLRSAFF
jgi:hypothetical protein